MYCLMDAHSFYAACEAVWRPSLLRQPYVVLGNNDGAVVARSELARSIGIKMGVPWFKIKELQESKGLIGLSANFPLYCDMSARMHSLMAGLSPDVFQYSVDEAMANLDGMPGDHTQRAWLMRERIQTWLGLAVGAGIGKTRTLAKLASHVSKQAFRRPGTYPTDMAQVCNLGQCAPEQLRDIMANTPVGDVWGVGRRYAEQLLDAGILTALDLANIDIHMARARWGINLERTVRELTGISCISLEGSVTRQQIMCSRSLAKPVMQLHELQQLATQFASQTAVKLRQQGSVSGAVSVFAMTSPFRPGTRFSRSAVIPLSRATDDTRQLAHAASQGMRQLFEPHHEIVKVGVMLLDIISRTAATAQGCLELDVLQCSDAASGPLSEKSHALMLAVDGINERYGRDRLRNGNAWVNPISKQQQRTPHYTTSLRDVPTVRA